MSGLIAVSSGKTNLLPFLNAFLRDTNKGQFHMSAPVGRGAHEWNWLKKCEKMFTTFLLSQYDIFCYSIFFCRLSWVPTKTRDLHKILIVEYFLTSKKYMKKEKKARKPVKHFREKAFWTSNFTKRGRVEEKRLYREINSSWPTDAGQELLWS